MSNESKIRKDRETDKPKYDKFEDYGSRHTHHGADIQKVLENTMKVATEKILIAILNLNQEKVLENLGAIKFLIKV